MKSKFAKFVDATVGAVLIFAAATAVFRYFTTLDLAMFAASCVTFCSVLMLTFRSRKKSNAQKLSASADRMFFDFMFENDAAPARLLCRGLSEKGLSPVVHGRGVYVGNTAAFAVFDRQLDDKTAARIISRTKHYGATKAVILCKFPPSSIPDIDGFTVKTVYGDGVYRLYASLGALPKHKYDSKRKRKFGAFANALGKDKIARYLLLAASMTALSVLFRHSITTVICAGVCAALFVASSVFNIIKAAKSKRRDDER